MDVSFVTENDPYKKNGYEEMFPLQFHLWMGWLQEMSEMVGIGYRPFENELTHLDWRAMALIKRFQESGNGHNV